MRALDADGRPAEALEAYRAAPRGSSPTSWAWTRPPALRRAGGAGSCAAEAVGAAAGRASAAAAVPPVHAAGRLPWRPGGLLGRQADLALLLRVPGRAAAGDAGRVRAGSGRPGWRSRPPTSWPPAARDVWWADLSDGDARSGWSTRWRRRRRSSIPRGADPRRLARAARWAATAACCAWTTRRRCSTTLAPLVERLLEAAPGAGAAGHQPGAAGRRPGARARPGSAAPAVGRGPEEPRRPAVRRAGTGPGGGTRSPTTTSRSIAATCRRLDGLPLAIELGAARAPAFGLGEFAERLGQGLDLLVGGRRTAAERHRSVRAVVDWSYGLLTDGRGAAVRAAGRLPGLVRPRPGRGACAPTTPLSRAGGRRRCWPGWPSSRSSRPAGAGSGCWRPCGPTPGSGSGLPTVPCLRARHAADTARAAGGALDRGSPAPTSRRRSRRSPR